MRGVLRGLLWIVFGVMLGLAYAGERPGARAAYVPGVPTLEHLRTLSLLVTARVQVRDVQVTQLCGYTGGVRALVVVAGEVQAGTDLTRAKLEALDRVSHTAVLVLAEPAATSARVDLIRTRVYAMGRTGMWRLLPGSEPERAAVNQALVEAQGVVARAGEDQEVRLLARRQGEEVVRAWFEAGGWTVTIRWGS